MEREESRSKPADERRHVGNRPHTVRGKVSDASPPPPSEHRLHPSSSFTVTLRDGGSREECGPL